MKNFLAIYLGSPQSEAVKKWGALDEETRKQRTQAGMKAWMDWHKEHDQAVVDMGCPIGKTKMVSPQGISDTKNLITGYTIVKAESHAEAAALFKNHPHFSIFPGDSVEIMECLPIPKA